jgi:predicted TIM-barrel fold metal-dependent hydrolase
MTVEWNVHIFSPDLERYPFHPKAAYRPKVAGAPADPLGAYLKRMEEEGIDRAVIVHPEPYGDDHRLVLECLRREPERLKGTSLYYPTDPDAPRKLADLVAQEPRIIATRFHAHRGKAQYLETFADPGVRALWTRALELGLIIELHIGPNYARQVAAAMGELDPNARVLIDHLAEPHLGTPMEFADVLDLARFPHVYMKLSGLGHFAQDGPLYPSATPFTRQVIRAFGPARCVWGSGTPRIVDAHMQGYPTAARDLVRGGNLARLLGWS